MWFEQQSYALRGKSNQNVTSYRKHGTKGRLVDFIIIIAPRPGTFIVNHILNTSRPFLVDSDGESRSSRLTLIDIGEMALILHQNIL